MVLSPIQDEILAQLVRQEEMMAELYDIFSNQFPHHASFWKELSLAEVRHAKLLEGLRKMLDSGQLVFKEGNLTITTLAAYLMRLEEVIRKARKGAFNLETALSCAVDYESSLVERRVFLLFDSSDRKVRDVLDTLHSETDDHVEFIKNIQRSVSRISQQQSVRPGSCP